MYSILKLIGLSLVGIVFAVAIAVTMITQTSGGRSWIAAIAEQQLASILGGPVEITGLGPGLPSRIYVERMTLSDTQGSFAEIQGALVELDPLAAITGNVRVSVAQVESGTFLRLPVLPESQDEDATPPQALQLPEAFPSIALENIHLNSIELYPAVFGGGQDEPPTELSADGRIVMGGRDITADFIAQLSDPETGTPIDSLAVEINRPTRTDLIVDLRLASPQAGYLSRLLGAGDAVLVTANHEGPVNELEIMLAAQLGTLGQYTGDLSGDPNQQDFRLSLQGTPGSAFDNVRDYLGTDIFLNVSINALADGISIAIDEATARIGSLSGTASWTNRNGVLSTANLSGNFSPGEGSPPDLAGLVTDGVDIAGQLSPDGKETYAIAASVSSNAFSLTLKDAKSDLATQFRGISEFELKPIEEIQTYLPAGLSAAGIVDVTGSEKIALEGFSLTSGSDLQASINARLTSPSNAIDANGKYSLSPDFLKRQVPDVTFLSSLTGTFDVDGTTEDILARLNATISAIRFDEEVINPSTITLELRGSAEEFEAQVDGSIDGTATSLNGDVAREANGQFQVSKLSISADGASLDGSGAFDPATQTGAFSLEVQGEPGAMLLPALPLEGSLIASGQIADSEASSSLSLLANSFRVLNYELNELSVSGSGPLSAFALEASAQRIANEGALLVDSFKTESNLNLEDGVSAQVSSLSVRAQGFDVEAQKPFNLVITDGLSIEGLGLELNQQGRLLLDARLSPQRWEASGRLDNLNIPETLAATSAAFSLDTDQPKMASGDFSLFSLASAEPKEILKGEIEWNGSSLSLRHPEEGSGETFVSDLTFPLLLQRDNGLSINAQGALSGSARYQGPLEPLAAFLPPALQTLEGITTMSVSLSGETSAPAVDGSVSLENGGYTDVATGLTIANIAAQSDVSFKNNAGTLSFTADASGAGQTEKTMKTEGRIVLGNENSVNVTLDLNGASFIAGPIESLIASGSLALSGDLDRMAASGTFEVEELNAGVAVPPATGLTPITVVRTDTIEKDEIPTVPTDLTAKGEVTGPLIDLDIALKAPQEIFIRGRGLESEWSADVRLTGNSTAPLLVGGVNVRRGTIDFAGRRFDISTGEIAFDRLGRNDPRLDLRAEYEADNDLTAAIVVGGRGSAPTVNLASTPSLPNEDIMAVVLFGKAANQLSAFESLQVAQALAQLGGVGPFGGGSGLTGTARSAVGLDMLNLDLDSDTGASALTVGKYLADGLFVSASQNARGDQGSVRVEYEVTDSISLETLLEQDGDQTVSANWKRDF
ncbi:MAG: translocation/assembly module TamB domain-containing protein [Pseudomonadota bacterium]